jgi:hypothetical protein
VTVVVLGLRSVPVLRSLRSTPGDGDGDVLAIKILRPSILEYPLLVPFHCA